MTDPRLAWFAIGASCSAVLFGWPWHPRFSRYSQRMGPPRGSYGSPRQPRGSNPPPPGGKPRPPQCPPRFSRYRSISFPDPGPDRQPTNPFTGDPVLYCRREYFHSPSTVAECGGPCEAGPEHCDCGQLWRDVPVHFDPGRVQRGNNSGGPTTPKPAIMPKPQFPPTKSTNTPDS